MTGPTWPAPSTARRGVLAVATSIPHSPSLGRTPRARGRGCFDSSSNFEDRSIPGSLIVMASTPKLFPAELSAQCQRGDAALARAFGFLGKRWNAVILGILGEGPAGFRDLSRAIGPISDSVLSQR